MEYKHWDSDFFHQAIYNINYQDFESLDASIFNTLSNALVQIKIPAHCVHLIDRVQKEGFILVETELSFVHDLNHVNAEQIIIQPLAHALVEDLPQVEQLAATSFNYSRFRTPWFHENDSARLYAEWTKKAVLKQYDDVCLKINNLDGALCGIVTAKKLNEHDAQIGLICVTKQQQSKNIGTSLLYAIEQWAIAQGLQNLYVATQGANQRACQFYLRNNYKLNNISYWFYKRVYNDSF